MIYYLKKYVITIFLIKIFFYPLIVFAATGTQTGQMNVSATVNATCTINSSPVMSFGTYDRTVDTNIAQGLLNVTCSPGVTFTVTLNNGLNFSTTRRMVSGGTNYLNYGLFSDSGRTTAWATPSITSTGAAQDVTSYGKIPTAQNVAAGSYTDTVIFTFYIN